MPSGYPARGFHIRSAKVIEKMTETANRNQIIVEKSLAGDTYEEIARYCNLTRGRVWQIVEKYRRAQRAQASSASPF